MSSRQKKEIEETQPCKACGVDHPISYFRKNGKNRKGEQRYYADCKYAQMGVAPPAPKEPTPKRVIEPIAEKQASQIIEPARHETSSLASAIDFAPLESICGKELSPIEKTDAVQRFNEFISLLRSEYGKEVRSHVYIKR